MNPEKFSGARLLVRMLERHGVRVVFGIPGAKIDSVFDELMDSTIRLVVCRHEQNAAFMAAAHGRITGEPGVVLVTSGPGVTNLTTGLLTATTEGDPVVALGGAVPVNMALKSSHQNTDNVKIMEAVTKRSVAVGNVENLQEAVVNAFRIAKAPRKGAVFLSLPADVLKAEAQETISAPAPDVRPGPAPESEIRKAAALLAESALPVVFFGEDASSPEHAETLRQLLEHQEFPVISTFQGAGIVSRELFSRFIGRVGLFKNQPGDRLLDAADTVLTVGYNPVEYDPEIWNAGRSKRIIHLDSAPCQIHSCYQPEIELLGDISANASALSDAIRAFPQRGPLPDFVRKLHEEIIAPPPVPHSVPGKIQPRAFVAALREFVRDEDYVMCDVGTVYMYMARHFMVFRPRQLLFSNGQQTLGVALPWAVACKLARPDARVFSVSGDGGFLFSAMELETAVREKTPFVHFVWTDGTYNMVLEQELLKYGRGSGVALGPVDIVSYAAAFGAKGYRMHSLSELDGILEEAVESPLPVLIDVPVDYSANRELFVTAGESVGN